MKKFLLILVTIYLSLFCQIGGGNAQDLSNYSFSTDVDQSRWITLSDGATLLVSSGYDDQASPLTDIGFPFLFGGNINTQFWVNSNGILSFNGTPATSFDIQYLSSEYQKNQPKICGISRDMSTGTSGYVKCELTGSAPNRILVCEFKLTPTWESSVTADVMWQVQLHESGSKVIFIYGETPSTAPSAFQIGLSQSSSDILTINPSTHETIHSEGAVLATYNEWPGAYRYYEFNRPVSSCPVPYSLNVVPNSITSSSVELSWIEQGSATAWQICLNGDEDNLIDVTENPYTLSGLTPETDYSVKVRANCGGDGVSPWWSIETTFTTDVSCHAPTNQSVADITATTASFSWEGETNSYDVRYGQSISEPLPQYDDGTRVGDFGWYGMQFYWAAMYPANTYLGGFLSKVSVYDNQAMTGSIFIYNDGETAPSNLVGVRQIEFTGAGDFVDFVFPNAPAIDNSKNLWIVILDESGATYPAAYCADQGFANARWINLDGNWIDITSYNINCTWMIRGTIVTLDGTETIYSCNSNTYPLTGLDPTTDYLAQVRANCGANDGLSRWTSSFFTTTELCPTPSDLSISNLTPTSVELSWSENGTASAWQICVNGDEENLIDAPTNPYTLPGLTADTEYSVKVRANCGGENGISAWSGAVSFTTLEICPKPTGLTATSNGTIVTATWEGNCSKYIVNINNDVYEEVYTNSITFEGELATVYTISVQSVCSETIFSSWTNPVSVTTDICLPVNQCNLTFELTDGYGDGWNGAYIEVIDVATSSTIATLEEENHYLHNQATTDTYPLSVCDGREIQFQWHVGQYDTECSFVIYDINGDEIISGGPSDLPYTYLVDCIPSTCKKTTNPTVSDITPHEATLSWTERGTATEWVVAYKAVNETNFTERNIGTNMLTLTDLIPATGYTVKVRPVCEDEVIKWSNEVNFTTAQEQGPCLTPTNFTAYNVTENSVELSWTAATNALNYIIKKVETDEWYYVNESPYTITGLTPGTTYHFMIVTYCYDGYSAEFSDWSNAIAVTTLTSACPAPTDLYANAAAHSAILGWSGTGDSYNVRYQEYNGISEGFEDGILPEGWTATITSSYSGVKTEAAHTGSYGFRFSYTEYNGSIVSPLFDGTDNGVVVSFYYKESSDYYGHEQFYVGYTTDENVTDPDAFTYGDIITASLDWEKFESTFPAGTKRVAIKYVYNNTLYLYIDDIDIFTPNSNWTSVTSNTTTQEITGLTPETAYIEQVQSVCGEEQSDWSDYVIFTTEASCLVPTDLSVTNDGMTITVTWEGSAEYYNIDINGEVTEGVTSPHTFNSELATSYTVMVQAVCGEADNSRWTSPISYCLAENQCELTFELTDSYGDGWNGAYIEVIDVATSSTIATLAEESHGLNNQETTDIYPLSICDGREIQFVWHSGSFDSECSYVVYDANDEEIFSGSSAMTNPVNYNVVCVPSNCKRPTSLTVSNITTQEATLSWTERGTATEWVVAYKAVNETNFTERNIGTNMLTLTDLIPATGYTVKVRPVCEDEVIKWGNEVNFTTAQGQGPCLTPTNFTAYNVTENSVDLSWTGVSNADYYHIKKVVADEWWHWEEFDVYGSPYTLTGLALGTTYNLQILTGCFNESSDWSDVITITTLNPACPTPTNLVVNYLGGNTAEVSWTSDAGSWNIDLNGTVINVSDNPYTLTNLDYATDYNVRVQAVCGEEISGWSDTWFSTELCAPEYKCSLSYTLTGANSNSWEGSSLYVVDASTGTTVTYLTMNNETGPLNGTIPVCEDRELSFMWFSGNTPDECGFVITDNNGNEILNYEMGTASAWGVIATHMVNCGFCPSSTNLVVSEITESTAQLTWEETGEATSWIVAIKDPWSDDFWEWGQTSSTTETLYLSPETEYTVKVRSVCSDGFVRWSNEETFTTESFVCIPQTDVAVSDITTNSAVVTWSGSALSWEIDWKASDDADFNVYFASSPLDLDYLASGTTYIVKVRGYCQDGPTDWTEITFTTEIAEYNVTLHPNSGTINSDDVTSYTYGVGATLPTDVTLTGYSFGGWYDNEYFYGEPVTAISATETGAKEFWAKWNINSYLLTINYKYANGTEAAPTHTETLDYNAGYTVTSPTITGYTADQEVVSGTMGTEAVTVDVTYGINSYLLTINYKYSDGTTAYESYTNMMNYEGYYYVLSPEITGYTPDQVVVSGTMGTEAVTVDVTYNINSYNLTINYKYANGTEAAPAYTQTLDYNAAYAVTSPTITGYTADRTEVSGTMGTEAVTVDVTYYEVIVNIVDATNCSGVANGSLTVVEPTTNFEYSLDGVSFQTENLFGNLAAGDYTLYIRPVGDSYNFTGSYTVMESEFALPTVSVSSNDSVFCINGTVEFNSNGSSVGSEYSYAWTGPESFSSSEMNPTRILTDGNMSGVYTLTITNTSTQCESSKSLNIYVDNPTNSNYAFTIRGYDAVANVIPGEVTTSDINILNPVVNHFMNDIVEGYSASNVTFSNNAETEYTAGIYEIIWIATDACGNIARDTITLTVTEQECAAIQDVDGNIYQSVRLGSICWMAENLKTTRYADGREITNIYKYYHQTYPNVEENVSIYGLLYDWYDAMDVTRPVRSTRVQGICPDGWYLPNEDDFQQLNNIPVEDLRSSSYWMFNQGTNNSGFDLRPGGLYNHTTSRYENLHGNAYLWSVADVNSTDAHCHMADCHCYLIYDLIYNKLNAFSVRCVKGE